MSRFLLGLVVGSVGTAACMYGLMALLPATSETPEREPLVGPRDPARAHDNCHSDTEGSHCDCHADTEYHVGLTALLSQTSGDGHVRWTPLT